MVAGKKVAANSSNKLSSGVVCSMFLVRLRSRECLMTT